VRLLRFALVAFALLAPSAAWAQAETWSAYPSSVYREGPGLRVGNAPIVFHPGFILEGGYDTNVFYSPPGKEVGAGVLRLRAHMDIATLPPQRMEGDTGTADPKVDFRFSGQVEYRQYLSSLSQVLRQGAIDLIGIADLGILPKGPFTLRINETFIRTSDPRNYEVTIGTAQFPHDFNRFGVLAGYRAGRLEFGIGDYVDYNHWEDPDLRFDMVHNEAEAVVRYRFLPQTTASLVMRVGYIDYFHAPQFEAIPVRAYAVVDSLITRWLGTYDYIGYGNSLHQTKGTDSFNSAIAHVEFRFYLPKGSQISLGYDRDFFDSLFANYFTDDAGFISFDQPLVYRMTAHLDGGIRYRQYYGLNTDPSFYGAVAFIPADHRNDIVYSLHAQLSIKALNWLQVSLNYNLQGDKTDFIFQTCGGPSPMQDPTTMMLACPKDPTTGMEMRTNLRADYLKHSVLLRLDFAY
jgi:hypothetical protein